MLKIRIQVGHYYTLTLPDHHPIVFSVLYGFERGKNKDVYTIRIYDTNRDFEFPIEEATFTRWASEGRIQEITPEDALRHALSGS
jgi:hypothetical protein